MRIQTEEWRRFIPGVRMYKGKKTLFYNGEKLWEGFWLDGVPLIYDEAERYSWEVIIVLPGVEIIPDRAFSNCWNVKTVIMADTVKRIDDLAFCLSFELAFVRLSENLEYIGEGAFNGCRSLTSIFIPPSCRKIGDAAFRDCKKLIILHVPQQTQLSDNVIAGTALIMASPFKTHDGDLYNNLYENHEEVDEWLKNINMEDRYALHQECSSFTPNIEVIHEIVGRNGLKALEMKNAIGMTPLQYLESNPFTYITEKEITKQFILGMMGEVI